MAHRIPCCLAFQLALAAAATAQPWTFTLSTTTDSLPRLFQAMRVEIPADQFTPALPRDPGALSCRLRSAPGVPETACQLHAFAETPGKVTAMWMEESLPPRTSRTWLMTVSNTAPASPAFRTVKADSGIDLVHGDRKVYRYQDVYDPQQYGLTRRPWHHIYGSDGKYITKGNEGEHPHQRGIFMGWNVNDHGYWTNGGGTVQIHQGYDSSLAVSGPVFSRVSSKISWQHNKVEEILETRTVEAWWVKPGVTVLDFKFTLAAPGNASFALEGEGAHAGMQFRAADEVNVNRENPELSAHHFSQDGPIRAGYNYLGKGRWIGQTFPVRGVKYLGLVMDHSSNPVPAEFPTRDYGRFGIFFNHTQPAGKDLQLYYRYVITDRSVQDSAGSAATYNSFQHPPSITATPGSTSVLRRFAPRLFKSKDAHLAIRLIGTNLVYEGTGSVEVVLREASGRKILHHVLSTGGGISLSILPKGLIWLWVRSSVGEVSRTILVH